MPQTFFNRWTSFTKQNGVTEVFINRWRLLESTGEF